MKFIFQITVEKSDGGGSTRDTIEEALAGEIENLSFEVEASEYEVTDVATYEPPSKKAKKGESK